MIKFNEFTKIEPFKQFQKLFGHESDLSQCGNARLKLLQAVIDLIVYFFNRKMHLYKQRTTELGDLIRINNE